MRFFFRLFLEFVGRSAGREVGFVIRGDFFSFMTVLKLGLIGRFGTTCRSARIILFDVFFRLGRLKVVKEDRTVFYRVGDNRGILGDFGSRGKFLFFLVF